MKYADVIVDISHEKLDKVYQYAIPSHMEGMALVGLRVNVPFGSRQIKGYIVNISDKPSFDPAKTKSILSVADKEIGIDGIMIKVAYYIRQRYGATINDALKTVMPVKKIVKNKEKRYITMALSKEEYNQELRRCDKDKRLKARYRLLSAFSDTDIISEDFIIGKIGVSKSTINAMIKDGILGVKREIKYRNPIGVYSSNNNNIVLNPVQRKIADEIITDYDRGIRKPYLIHGVTGSGKTQVYMEIIEHVVKSGRQVIMLIPEISLTYQTVKRFYARFGDRISIMNSRLSAGERYDQYMRARNNNIDIMIGPRSALFTPFERLGLIVIDEEHESSYKSEMPPKYDARQVALFLAAITGASTIFGSATPSVSTYYKAIKGEYKLFSMKDRAGGAQFPDVYVEDLRKEMREGNKSIFSRRLYNLINDRLNKNEQIMLFINRRGYSGFVSCRSCGHIIKCPHCDVSLTYHSENTSYGKYESKGRMVCHYCGYEIKAYDKCPKCSSKYISLFGTGTQKVEMYVKQLFRGARILRMDADTTSGKNGHQEILSAFADNEADILIGTQMIVKGHDFPNVTLVGILAADLSLGSNDYNASENTFQLLVQAAGRAGRGKRHGEVVIQTYRPDHYSIVTAAKGDYEKFFRQEMLYRKIGGYPPAGSMLCILIMSAKEEKAHKLSQVIKNIVSDKCDEELIILGPSDALVSKLNDIYRKVLYIKSTSIDKVITIRNDIQDFLLNDKVYKDCTVHFDLNPTHCQ